MTRVTIKDLAERTGFTPATVSMALRGSTLVAEKTRKRICQMAHELGYIPNARARSLQSMRNKTLGMVVPSLEELYIPTLVNAAYQRARERGYGLQVVFSGNTPEQELEAANCLLIEQIEGVIFVPADGLAEEHPGPGLDLLVKNHVALAIYGELPKAQANRGVIAMRQFARLKTECVLLDHRSRAALITRLRGTVESVFAREQVAGYREAMRQYQVADFEPLIVADAGDRELVQLGYEAAKDLWLRHGPLQAYIAGNDNIAQGIGFFMVEQDIWFPKVAMVSMTEPPVAPFRSGMYASSHIPLRECGEGMVDLVVGELEDPAGWKRRLWLYHPCHILRPPSGQATTEEILEFQRQFGEERVIREEIMLEEREGAADQKFLVRA